MLKYFNIKNFLYFLFFLITLTISINSDDPGIFGMDSMALDFVVIVIYWNFTLDDIFECLQNSIKYSAFPDHLKKKIQKRFDDQWIAFKQLKNI